MLGAQNIALETVLAAALAVGVTAGCAGDEEGASAGSKGTSGSSSGSSAGSTSAGSTTIEATGSASAGSTTSETTGSTSAGSTTTGGLECELVAQAEAAVAPYGAFVECGEVDPWHDGADAWVAVHQCAIESAAAMKAFKAIAWVQGIDSQVGYAYVGQAFESFALAELFYDSWGPKVTQRPCSSLTATPGCTVAPGEICLRCGGDAAAATLCGE